MSYQGASETRQAHGVGPQNTVFRRPRFQIAVCGSGSGTRLGVVVVAAPSPRRDS